MGSGLTVAIDPEALLKHDFGETRQHYTERDEILYALGVGLGRDPVDSTDLAFLDERTLTVLPTFAVTLASPGMWLRDPRFGIDFSRLVHIAQDATFHAALPPEGEIVGTARVASLADRGPDRGAELVVERHIGEASTGRLLCSLRQILLLRGDGGYGGAPPVHSPATSPNQAADLITQVTLSPRAALIYRLSGDWNPLHLDPQAAEAAGFERPIMHGLGVYGTVAAALCRTLGRSPQALQRLACRFSGIVMPGAALDLRIWSLNDGYVFEATVAGRRVLDQGLLELCTDS